MDICPSCSGEMHPTSEKFLGVDRWLVCGDCGYREEDETEGVEGYIEQIEKSWHKSPEEVKEIIAEGWKALADPNLLNQSEDE